MIAIVDYGVGNLFSLRSSFEYIGADIAFTGDADVIRFCDKIVLPGVGAFADAADKLRMCGLDRVICEEAKNRKPVLGICLGMQLLMQKSYEYGEHEGLGLIEGSVEPISKVIPTGYKIPHIGWNALRFPAERPKSPLFRYVEEGEHVYFVHSYYADVSRETALAKTEYGAELTAAVGSGNIYGCQFHPEKSGSVGLNILRAFCEL